MFQNNLHVFGCPFYFSSKQQSFNESGPLIYSLTEMNERVLWAKVVLTFESVDKTLQCDHSKERQYFHMILFTIK